jgi:hypothetical protein
MNLSIAWYKPEQWQRLLGVSADLDQLEKTFGEWQIMAEKAFQNFAAQGVFPEKVVVDVENILAWCNERELPVNGESRSQYASRLLWEEKDMRTGENRS